MVGASKWAYSWTIRSLTLYLGSTQGFTQGSLSGRPPVSSPQQILRNTPKRPGMGRRAPSTSNPQRGQEFSVDDDLTEVELDRKLSRTSIRPGPQSTQSSRTLRRKESTLRRRPTAQPPALPRVESDEAEEEAQTTGNDVATQTAQTAQTAPDTNGGEPSSEDTLQGDEEEESPEDSPSDDEDDDADISDAESFTLKDRQEAINETHPFGIRIWKPALYKKSRSVQKNAEGDIHSIPGGNVSRWLFVFNIIWTITFGLVLAVVAALGAILCTVCGIIGLRGCTAYSGIMWNLSAYLLYPFGKFVKLEHHEDYLDEDEGEGRSVGEYERWQTGDLEEGRLFFGPTDINRSIIGRRRESLDNAAETESLLGRQRRHSQQRAARLRSKKRLFGRGEWNVGRVIFFFGFYFLLAPLMFLVSGICWFLVFTIPMGKVMLLLFYHLRRHPLALSFHSDSHQTRSGDASGSSILLCTYRAVGTKYWKYTIDGTNIFLINLLGLVAFAIFDYFVLLETLHIESWITSPALVFVLGLASIIPLAYFIGQAVASISAQSSMGVGATINAFFSTVVEVFLYCVALDQGKAQLVEGSIIGSIFAGILLLPGLSMCFGALKRKTQRFNVKSAGVTSTMLLFAVIGAFGPTLFYQIYGSHELNCHKCVNIDPFKGDRDCSRCYFAQVPAVQSRFYKEAVRPYIWFAAITLFLSYVIGLLFTLRTHAAVIWNNEPDEKKDAKMDQAAHHMQHAAAVPGTGGLVQPEERAPMTRNSTAGTIPKDGTLSRDNIRDTVMYKRILNQGLRQAGINASPTAQVAAVKSLETDSKRAESAPPYMVPPKTSDGEDTKGGAKTLRISGLSVEDNRELVQQVAEMAATAATAAARDATKAPRRASAMATTTAPQKPTKQTSGSSNTPKDLSASGQLHRATNVEPGSLGDFEWPTGEGVGAGVSTNAPAAPAEPAAGGHDAPNWSRTKSAIILLSATVAYAIIAEILVDTVDVVLSSVTIDEKFLGITLFSLVPNTTEFLNAISFAMNGNIALSMEIGSAYALQVILLQVPALVLFSAVYGQYIDPADVIDHTFTMLFPQWDMVTVILGVFLMGWVVGEGKSNYFKGSTLILTYLVVIVGFYFSGYNNIEVSWPPEQN